MKNIYTVPQFLPKKNTAKFITIIVGLLLLLGHHRVEGQSVIAGWDFTGGGGYTTLNAGTISTSLVSPVVLLRGTGAASSAAANSFRTVGFKNDGIATTNTDYFQTSLQATTGNTLSLSAIDGRLNGTSTYCPATGQFAYSLDGSTFTLIGSPFSTASAPTAGTAFTTISLSGITALQNVPATTTIYLRFYASGNSATGGWGFYSNASGVNGLAISGTLTAVVTGCSGTPTSGTVAGSATYCSSSMATNLSVTGGTTGAGISYQWASATSSTGSYSLITGATTASYTVPAGVGSTTYYHVTTSCSVGGSSTSAYDSIKINLPPGTPSPITGTAPVCVASIVGLSDATTGGSWSSSNSAIASVNTAGVVSGVAAGSPVITYSVTNTCGSAVVTTTVTVNALPAPTLSGATTIVTGSSATLAFAGTTGTIVTYNWTGGAPTTTTLTGSGTASITVTPTVTTTYSLTSAISAAGCTATITGQAATITVTSSDAIPTRDDNMAMGNPSGAMTVTTDSNNYLLAKSQYTLSYNNTLGMANWVSWHLSTAWTGTTPRCNCFTQDATLPTGYFEASSANYTSTGFDRGHLCPSADRNGSDTDNAATYKMSNITPQAPYLNEQTWGDLEDYCRLLTTEGDELYIIAGAYGTGGSGSSGGTTTSIASGHINVPDHFYKIIVVLPVGINDVTRVSTTTRVIAVIMPNTQSVNSHTWDYYRVSVDSIEAITGYDFLSNVPVPIQAVIEAGVDNGPLSIAAWDFTGPGNTATAEATTYDANLDTTAGQPYLTRGSTAAASAGANSFRTTGFKNEGISTANTDYFQTKFKAKTGYTVSLTNLSAEFAGTTGFYATPGVTSQFAYSLDGSTFTLISSPVTSTNLVTGIIDLSGITALQNVPAATTITLRYYASGQTTTGGWGFYSSDSGVAGLTIVGTLNQINNCTGTPDSNTAIATPSAICAGSTSTLSVSGSSTSTGLTYQWASSTDSAAWTAITGATNLTYTTPALSSDIYYRLVTTCSYSGLSTASAGAHVNVIAAPGAVMPVTGTTTVCVAASTTLSDATTGGIWSSSNTAIATVSSTGAVTGIAGGSVTITYTMSNSCGSTYATASVTVNAPPAPAPIGGTLAVCPGTTTTLTGIPAGGNWSSSDATKATVDATGVVTGIAAGSATISYTASNSCGTGTVTAALTISSSPSISPVTGTTFTISAGGPTITLADATAGGVWSSDDATRATVTSGGVVNGEATGSTTIRYTITNACGSNLATHTVTVTATPTDNVVWNYSAGTGVAASSSNANVPAASCISAGGGAISTTSASSGTGFSGTDNMSNIAVAGAFNFTTSTYVNFTLTPNSGYAITITGIKFGSRSTTTGPPSYIVSTNLGGFGTALASGTGMSVGSVWAFITPASFTSSATGAAGAAVEVRIYGYGGTGTSSSANWRLDDITINYTAVNAICAGTPAAGIVAGSSSFCTSGSETLHLTSPSTTSGVSYQWGKSVTGAAGTFSDIAGATAISYTTPTVTATTYYNVRSTCSTSGSSNTSGNGTATINVAPAITVTATPAILCAGSMITVTTTVTGGTGTPAYAWSSPGIATVTGSATPPTSFTPTTAATAGIFSVSASYPAATGCGTVAGTQTITIAAQPIAAVSSPTTVCPGNTATLTASYTGGYGTPAYAWSGPGIPASTTTGTIPAYTVMPSGTAAETYSVSITFPDSTCHTAIAPSAAITTTADDPWQGTTSSDWNNAANWGCGTVPIATNDVVIPAGYTFAPALSTGTFSIHNFTLANATSISLSSGVVVNMNGDLTNNGTITGDGVVYLNGAAPALKGNGLVSNLTLDNSGGAIIETAGDTVGVTGALLLNSGTLTTNGRLILVSTAAGNGVIGTISGGNISGNVVMQQYVVGLRRAYRFIAHPFSASIPLSQIENYVDITGTHGATNGFTPTTSNAPSAYWYNTLTGNSDTGSDPGWKAFSNTNGVDTNAFKSTEGIRLYFRGSKGQGLTGDTYTVNPATYSTWGPVNQGPVNVTLVKGTGPNEDYNLVGNPYPAVVDLGQVLYNMYTDSLLNGASFYVWNPQTGTNGQFKAWAIGNIDGLGSVHYYLAANESFEVRTRSNGTVIPFTETNKGGTPSQSLMRGAGSPYLTLSVYDTNYHLWDELDVQFTDQATDKEDIMYDGAKPPSPASLNFYSLSADHRKLALDARPYATEKVIQLGIKSSYAQGFIIRADHAAVPVNGQVYLHDKLIGTYTRLTQGAAYKFAITKDTLSQGEQRFELRMGAAETTPTATNSGLHVQLLPNPATDEITISYTAGAIVETSIRIMDVSGATVITQNLGNQQSGKVSLSLAGLANGLYMVELTSGNEKAVNRLIKE